MSRKVEWEQKLAREKEAEKEKRVAHLQSLGVRRLVQGKLARGWSAWLEQYEEAKATTQRLRSAATRLARPQLAAATSHWRRDWEAAVREEEAKRLRLIADEKQRELDAVLRQVLGF